MKESRGEQPEGYQPAPGPHAGMRYARDGHREEKVGRLKGATGGGGGGAGAQPGHTAGKGAVCGHAGSALGGLFSSRSRKILHSYNVFVFFFSFCFPVLLKLLGGGLTWQYRNKI